MKTVKVEYLSARGAAYYGSKEESPYLICERMQNILDELRENHTNCYTLSKEDFGSLRGFLDALQERF